MDWTYDILEPAKDLQTSLDKLTKTLIPLYNEHWVREKSAKYGNPQFDMNAPAFVSMWMGKSMKIFIAYDQHGAAQGYMTGMVFRPLTHNEPTFEIDDWYVRGGGKPLEDMFKYVYSVVKYMGIDTLQVAHFADMDFPQPSPEWETRPAIIMNRWKKA